MRLVDADALIPMMKYATTDNEIGIFPIKIGFDAIVKVINEQPTIEPGRKKADFEKGLHDMFDHIWDCEIDHPIFQDTVGELMEGVIGLYYNTIKPERIEYIRDTKVVPSGCHYVDLSERVTATFYSEECEEWTQQTVTIEDVLGSVCDDYTVVEPDRNKGIWYALEKGDKGYSAGDFKCSVCGKPNHTWIPRPNFCPNCGADMRLEESEDKK